MRRKKIKAALMMPKDVPGILARNMEIYDCLTGNTWITTPDPDLVTYLTHINDLNTAQAAIHNGEPGATDARDKKLEILLKDAESLLGCVQKVANNNGSHAVEIILSAGMYVVDYRGRIIQMFAAHSTHSQEVNLTAPVPAGKKNYCIIWFVSTDGINWEFKTATPVAETKLSNLISGNLYYFNYKVTIGKEEMGDFHDAISCRIK